MRDVLLVFITIAVILMAVELTYLTVSFLKVEVALEKTFPSLKHDFTSGPTYSKIGATKASTDYDVGHVVNLSTNPGSDGKSATITWTSRNSVIGEIEYGTTPASLVLKSGESSPTTNHSITLTSLKPNTNYYFRIKIGNNLFNNNGIPFSFKTNQI